MTKPRVTEADRAYFRRLREESEQIREVDPAGSLEEVLRRLEAMERRLGSLAASTRPRDEVLLDQEAASVVLRFRRGRGLAA